MPDGVATPVVFVGELFPQAVDVVASAFERQVAQHVVERAVLEHQDDDVVDLPQVGHGGGGHLDACGWVVSSPGPAAVEVSAQISGNSRASVSSTQAARVATISAPAPGTRSSPSRAS